jgi:hypothetical protein
VGAWNHYICVSSERHEDIGKWSGAGAVLLPQRSYLKSVRLKWINVSIIVPVALAALFGGLC